MPKKLLLALSVLIALAVGGYLYFFSAIKTISAAQVKVDSNSGGAPGAVLTVSGYVVAHHKIDVGAKVMGRVAWIGVEKGDKVQQGQLLVRLEDQEFRAQVSQAQANQAAAQARLDQLQSGSRPQEKLKDKAGVLQAEANLQNAEAEYERAAALSVGSSFVPIWTAHWVSETPYSRSGRRRKAIERSQHRSTG